MMDNLKKMYQYPFAIYTLIIILLDRPSKPFRVTGVLVLVALGVLLVTGCVGDCPQVLHTTTITKLDANGSFSWSKVFNIGLSNTIADLVPTSDGGFTTVGSIATTHSSCTLNYQPQIIRFTSMGKILWDQRITTGERGVWGIIPMKDGGFVALIDGSKIYSLNSDGRVLWNNSTGYVSSSSNRIAIGETSDGGVIVGGPVFMKFDSNGNILWKRSNINQSDWGFFSINEMRDGHGYLVFSSKKIKEIQKLIFNAEGYLQNSSEIIIENELTGYRLFVTPDGYRLLFSEGQQNITMIHFNSEGNFVEKKKIHGSEDITLTDDLGYFYITKISGKVKAIKLRPNGTPIWTNSIPNFNNPNINIIKVIQTIDGGYVIVSDIGIQKDISSLTKNNKQSREIQIKT